MLRDNDTLAAEVATRAESFAKECISVKGAEDFTEVLLKKLSTLEVYQQVRSDQRKMIDLSNCGTKRCNNILAKCMARGLIETND